MAAATTPAPPTACAGQRHDTRAGPRNREIIDPAEHERFVDGLIRAFDRGLLRAPARRGLETRRPVFVFGLPRSGTTLIEQVLASHSRIHGAGELRLARQSFEAIPGLLGRSGPPRDVHCLPRSDAAVRQLAEQHLEPALAAIDGGRCERIVDKMPDNYLYLGLLAVLFPRAVFIHCRRDLRDVAVSCWMTDFRSIRWANDRDHIAARFRQYRRLMDHWQARAARADPPGGLRGDGGRPRGGGPAAGRRLRPGLGAGLPRVPPHRAAGPHRQRHARSASRSISSRSPAGRTTRPSWWSWRICLPRLPGDDTARYRTL